MSIRPCKNVQGLAAAKDAQRSLFKDGDKMLDFSNKLTESYEKQCQQRHAGSVADRHFW